MNFFDDDDCEEPPSKIIKLSDNGDKENFSDTSSTITSDSTEDEENCEIISSTNMLGSNLFKLDDVVLQYPNEEETSSVEICFKHLLSLSPGCLPDKPIARFALKYMFFNGLELRIRNSILYFDVRTLEHCQKLASLPEDQLNFLRAHTLTPAKKYLVFPFEISSDPQGPSHLTLVIVTNFEAIFSRNKTPHHCLIVFAYVLDPNTMTGDRQHREKQLFRLSSLIKSYLSGIYHLYMRHSLSTEILVVLTTVHLPPAQHKIDVDLLTVTYLHYFFTHDKFRQLVLARQMTDFRQFKNYLEVPNRKDIFEIILSHVEPNQSMALRAQLAEESGEVDFFKK